MCKSFKVVAIHGSPRKDGRTSQLLNLVLDELKKFKEVEIETIYLIDHPVRFCMGCYSDDPKSCNPKNCTQGVLEDSMKSLHSKLILADAIIFATPVYWYNMSGMMKNFIDRLTSLENAGKLLDNKVAGFVVAAEEDGATQTISNLMAFANDNGMLIVPYTLVYSVGRNKISEDEEAVLYARRLGQNIYRMLKIACKVKKSWKEFDD